MIHARLSYAAKWSGAGIFGQDTEFSGIAIDSRRINPGSLFIALKGAHHDGHHHLDEVQSRGCRRVSSPPRADFITAFDCGRHDSCSGCGRTTSDYFQSHE